MKVLWVLAVLLAACCARDIGSRVSARRSAGQEDNGAEDDREIAPAVPHLNSPHYLRRRATTVLYDDFSSGRINPHNWEHTINAGFYESSHHFQMYTPEPVNTYVKHGILYIRPTLTVDTFGSGFLSNGDLNARDQWGSCSHGICHTHGWNSIRPIMSGMLRSYAQIQYGRVEIVAKLAKGDWFWNDGQFHPMKPSSVKQRSNHFQMYTPEPVNTYVKHGVLYIRPTLTVDTFGEDFLRNGDLRVREHWGDCTHGICHTHGWNSIHPIMSGMLRSRTTIKFGRVGIVAKLATGDWFWNALWMMPITSVYGPWPASGEIDLMERAGNRHYTNQKGTSVGIDKIVSSLHYGINQENEIHEYHNYYLNGTTFGQAFHKYWMDWREDHITIGVDDHVVLAATTPHNGYYRGTHQNGTNVWAHAGHSAPFDTPFELIMNVHVGGSPFGYPRWNNHPYDRPWDPDVDNQMMQFWNARHLWEPTWQGESAAMQIRSVKMQQY